jgi:hypothetical protein
MSKPIFKSTDAREDYYSLFDDDYYEDDEIIGYYCMCCGHDQDDTGLGYTCDMCGAMALEEIYF